MRVGVVTIVRGRHEHLAMQRAALARSTVVPDVHVVVAMDDPYLPDGTDSAVECRVAHVPLQDGHLPLAHARNVGAAEAVAAGAEVLVFLDVDCLPAADLVHGYVAAAADEATADDVLCGPVTYLPPPGPEGYPLDALDDLDAPHAARPAPPRGVVERSIDGYELFWSLSFALTRRTWDAIGGFDERYVGYGGEDTDFARRAERVGRALAWVGSARAYHQHHAVSVPPVEHLDDIVRNARLFHDTWGAWPMQGWLDEFERRGLVHHLPDGTYRVAAERRPAAEEVAAGGGGGTLESWLGSSRATPHPREGPMTVPTARPPVTADDVRAHTAAAWPLPGRGDTWRRWDLLAALAAADLPLVKIVEPHHDAVAILAELDGSPPGPDDIWAVWAAEPPFAVLTGVLRDGAWELDGTKAFCSGATIATHALVTAETPKGPRLFAVRLGANGIAIGDDRDWQGPGMRRADTRTLTFSHVPAEPVGAAGDYVDRVGFWAGGIGVAACWLGGARGVAATLERASGRLEPHGLAHLGAVRAALDVASLALRAAATRLDDDAPTVLGAERLAHVLRSHLADLAETTVAHVGRALGPGPLAFDGLHAEHVVDLQVFVRQHHAERDLERLGSLEQPGREGRDDA